MKWSSTGRMRKVVVAMDHGAVRIRQHQVRRRKSKLDVETRSGEATSSRNKRPCFPRAHNTDDRYRLNVSVPATRVEREPRLRWQRPTPLSRGGDSRAGVSCVLWSKEETINGHRESARIALSRKSTINLYSTATIYFSIRKCRISFVSLVHHLYILSVRS
jgi:hypothetical protein